MMMVDERKLIRRGERVEERVVSVGGGKGWR